MDLSPDTRRAQGEAEADIADNDELPLKSEPEEDVEEGEDRADQLHDTAQSSQFTSSTKRSGADFQHMSNINAGIRHDSEQIKSQLETSTAGVDGNNSSRHHSNVYHQLPSTMVMDQTTFGHDYQSEPNSAISYDPQAHMQQTYLVPSLAAAPTIPHPQQPFPQDWQGTISPDIFCQNFYMDSGMGMHPPLSGTYDCSPHIPMDADARNHTQYFRESDGPLGLGDQGLNDHRDLPLRINPAFRHDHAVYDNRMVSHYYSMDY